jgi:peptidyl-dipeptidase Dcp
MTAYRDQQRVDGPVTTIVSNNSNFIKQPAGQPVTLSWDDAKTMFHEFGHALHGLNSSVTYPSLSGTNTTRDFVEFPSQFFENYLQTPEVLAFLVNAQGAPIPAALLTRLEQARTFNEGFATAEAQASAIVDMKLHLAQAPRIDPKAFEQATLAELGMPPELVMRHRIPAFGHIFSGDGYAAGYYSYLWAEVLEHDAFEAFTEASGPYDAAVADRLRSAVLSVGNTVDPAQAFENFRGRGPTPDALLRFKGFPLPKGALR